MQTAQVIPQQPPIGAISIMPMVSTPIGTASIAINQPTTSQNKLEEIFRKAAKDHSFPPPEEEGYAHGK